MDGTGNGYILLWKETGSVYSDQEIFIYVYFHICSLVLKIYIAFTLKLLTGRKCRKCLENNTSVSKQLLRKTCYERSPLVNRNIYSYMFCLRRHYPYSCFTQSIEFSGI